jgi:hypothetical protein
VTTETKGDKNMDGETYNALHAECAVGFKQDGDIDGFLDSNRMATSSKAMTSDDATLVNTSAQLLAAASGDAIAPIVRQDQETKDDASAEPVAKASRLEGDQKAGTPTPSPNKDFAEKQQIPVLRNRAHDAQTSLVASLESSMKSTIVECHQMLKTAGDKSSDDAWSKFLDTLKSNVTVCELWTGECAGPPAAGSTSWRPLSSNCKAVNSRPSLIIVLLWGRGNFRRRFLGRSWSKNLRRFRTTPLRYCWSCPICRYQLCGLNIAGANLFVRGSTEATWCVHPRLAQQPMAMVECLEASPQSSPCFC